MADPTLITGATAVATGLIGYSGARLQNRAELDRLSIEQDRVVLERTRLEKELESAQSTQAREIKEARRLLYYDYLESAEAPWSLCQREALVTEGEIDDWWLAYQGVRRKVRLGGSELVVEKVVGVNGRVGRIFEDLVEAVRAGGSDHDTSLEGRIAVWNKHSGQVEPALRELEEAMRGDVSM